MFVWEMVSCRLRLEGWEVWHTTRPDTQGRTYVVHLHRPGVRCEVSEPTLTEAYAAAARRAREACPGSRDGVAGAHFGRGAGWMRTATGF
jgi:hypothetical protein